MYEIRTELLKMRREYGEIMGNIEKYDETKIKGSLRSSSRRGKYSYYVTLPEDTNCPIGGRYLSKSRLELAKAIANRDYIKELKAELKKQIRLIDRAIRDINYNKVVNVYEKTPAGKKELLSPLVQSDEEFIQSWLGQEYQHKYFQEGTVEIYSERGERVRSKSEKMIADKLLQMGIPYKYEAPLKLPGIGIIHPDFTILNVKERVEVYWEHLGMMDDPEYAENAVKRINQYAKNGIIPGKRLILTYETAKTTFDARIIDKLLEDM